MKVGQICGSSKNGAWVVVDVCISFFLGSLIRTHTGSFANRVCRHFSPIYKSRSNFGVVKKWVMGPS